MRGERGTAGNGQHRGEEDGAGKWRHAAGLRWGCCLRQHRDQRGLNGVDALDECYVFRHHAVTRDLVEAIKDGLKADGMSDLAFQVGEVADGKSAARPATRKVRRCRGFICGQATFV